LVIYQDKKGAGTVAKHLFTPSVYYHAIGSHPPVLLIKPGDSVTTATLDASGCDHTGRRVAPHGNPQTGPFYIDGAEPGDVLVVRFDDLRPNRSWGYSGCTIAANVVEPDHVYTIKRREDDDRSYWHIDLYNHSIILDRPKISIDPFVIPMEPMLGCSGVAPDRGQAISTATSGRHGGNMDYRGIVAGVTVYIPVFVEGALFHLGDGHAAQADGEILGRGIEVSMDVTFTVDVIKKGSAQWPRGENAHEIFTLGNARPLDQALRHATTEMLRWLQTDYGLDASSVHMLLGQFVRYEIGNVFDPAYTMVCKLPKEVLP
jgi:amidase